MAVVPPVYRMPRWLALAIAVSTTGFVALSMHLPLAILADAGFDDALFVKNAASILGGHWLGPYSQMTLAKGPGYPFFLAFNAILGFPVTLTQALLYSGSCAVLTLTLFRILGSSRLCLFGFLSMQWHPAMFPTRIIRDDLSASQVLLVLACLCHFVFLPTRLRNRLLWAAAGGGVLGWFWMTREDAIWIVPGLVVIGGLQALRLPAWDRPKWLAASLGVFAVAAIGAVALVEAINLADYGSFEIVDSKDPQFVKALDILQSVRVGEPVPYVPVPAQVRQKLDRVSPAFAELEPYFHGPGQRWTQYGCPYYPSTCNDIAGGWFIWAFRDAVASLGYYRTPAAAASFYHRLWSEVNAGCKTGQLECRKNLLSLMPAMRSDQWHALPGKLHQIYGLATWQDGQPSWSIRERTQLASSGSAAQIEAMQRFLGNPLAMPLANQAPVFDVAGWFRAPDHLWLKLRCAGAAGNSVLPVPRRPSPDLVLAFHSPGDVAQRFAMTLPSLKDCGFEPDRNRDSAYFSFGKAATGSADFAGGTLAIDVLSGAAGSPADRGQKALGLLGRISRFYGVLIPAATLLALLAYGFFLVGLFRRDPRRQCDATLIIVTGIGTLVLARAGILVLVDISSFPAIVPSYWGAGYPLLSLAIVLSLGRVFVRHR